MADQVQTKDSDSNKKHFGELPGVGEVYVEDLQSAAEDSHLPVALVYSKLCWGA